MFFWPFFWGGWKDRWKATSDQEVAASAVLAGRKCRTNILARGDALTFDDGSLYICTKTGYLNEPTRLIKDAAVVVPGRLKTPTELYP